jgi:DNA-binding transcriptional MerR regulator
MEGTRLTIGAAARLLGVSAKTLRHYQRLGLLSDSRREANGYRSFGAHDLLRVQQIRRLQALGLSLGKVRAILGAPDGEPSLCAALAQLYAEVSAEIAALESRRELIALLLAEEPQVALQGPLAPSPTLLMLEEHLGELGEGASPWMRAADAQLLGQLDAIVGADPAYRAQMARLARLAAEHPTAYRELLELGGRLEAVRDADPAGPAVVELAAAYRAAAAENPLMRAMAELPQPDGLPPALLGELMGASATAVLSPAQLRVLELAASPPD